jgi:cystathionine beta-lyase/cystathionine gamma-synthase
LADAGDRPPWDDQTFAMSTRAVHGGQRTDVPPPASNFPVPPLVLNSAILLDSVEQGWAQLTREEEDNYVYRRYGNPTVRLFEHKWARLEGAVDALAFASGMAAVYALFRAFTPSGGHVVTQHSLYHEVSDQLLLDKESCGVDTTLVVHHDAESIRRAMRPETRLVLVESPTNPSLSDVDIAAVAGVCREHGAILIVDNTMFTCVLQRPLQLGADLTLYSTTKTVNGHGDAVGGVVASDSRALLARLKSFRDNTGLIMDPLAAWLTVRGMRTLPLRLREHGRNAATVAAHLRARRPEYPVLTPDKTPHAAANGVTANPGIVVFTLPSREQATRFIRAVRLIRIGATFGNLESLVYHFATFVRPRLDLNAVGVDDGLVRLSVGIEDPADIIADLEQALRVSEAG